MKFKANPRTAWQSVGGEAVIVDIATGGSLGLNTTATFIWERLIAGDDETLIAEGLSKRFAVDVATSERDVSELVAELRRRGLILPSD
jgi:hypothetical protein